MRRELKVALLSATSVAIANAKDTCNALVLSGGGSNGAWEVGVLWGLLHYGNPADFEWDWMTGVSAGSINTAGFAGWAVGQELEATEWLSDTFTTLTSSQIWQEWPEGLARSVLGEMSLLDDSPSITFLNEILSEPRFAEGYKRNFTIATENVETGEYHLFTRDNVSFGDELVHAAMSSSSIPVVFPPQHFKGSYFMDGGTTWNVNIDSAIQGCLTMVDDLSKITVDILICSDPDSLDGYVSGNSIDNFLRRRQIGKYYVGIEAIASQIRAYPGVNWRYLIEEVGGTSGMDELNFNPEVTWPLQVQGREQALEVIAYGPGYGFDKFIWPTGK